MEVWLQPESTKPDRYPPQYSQVFGTARLDRGQPPGSRRPGSAFPPPSWDNGPGNDPGPRISSRPAQALPPPQRQKDGQVIGGERKKAVLARRLQRSAPPPRRGYLSPWPLPPRCGVRGGPGTRDLGAGTGRERDGREGEGREREKLVRESPTPGHAIRWSSASWMACASDVGTGPTRPLHGVAER